MPIAPVRVIDTTDGTGGITGPLALGTTVHTLSAHRRHQRHPAGSRWGSSATSPSPASTVPCWNGFGVATIFPAGEATPPTANINAGAGCYAISNLVTVGRGTGADAGKVSIVWAAAGPSPTPTPSWT